MNELENLKEIGIKEISRKTHIEPTFLQYIFDKNFEKLSRLNMRGYAKILQREYGVDLSELLAEYDAFMQENTPDDSHKTKVSPKIASYTPDDITNQRPLSSHLFFFHKFGVSLQRSFDRRQARPLQRLVSA